MKPIVLAALVVLSSSSIFAQSRVTDILIEQSNVAARAALQRAEIWNRVIADLTVAPLVLFPPRPVFVPPPVVAPIAPARRVASQQEWDDMLAAATAIDAAPKARDIQQRYLEEALAYARKGNTAAMTSAIDAYTAVAADCGLKPLKPLPPLGCRDLVAQCVIDPQGHAYWQWVCVK